ncbi:MAG: hypothetical protein IH849_14040 [Acidobacteria bacterium]|nr:hypothetical protein [Acidobacteriota bacterium]
MNGARNLLIVGLALATPACVFPTPAPQTVVLIVVDALRPDHLGVYGYG